MPSCHPFCASLSGLSHAPLPQLLRGSPETRAYCVEEAQRAGGRVECVCEYFAELEKAPHSRPPRSSKALSVPGARWGPPECLPGHDSW